VVEARQVDLYQGHVGQRCACRRQGRLEVIQSDFRLTGRISTFNRAIRPDWNMN
jgi:hypothetical protein